MDERKRMSLIKPTLHTSFHIDYKWWQQHDNNWRVHLLSCLCKEHKAVYSHVSEIVWLDWVDPETAEVQLIDEIQHTLMTHCAKEPDFLTVQTTLVDAVFRVFISNGNSPMTPIELSAMIGKPPEMILRTLSGPKVYKGLRPCF